MAAFHPPCPHGYPNPGDCNDCRNAELERARCERATPPPARQSAPSAGSGELPELGAIVRDETFDRAYIPVAPGWEIQTKGKGSTFRIAEPDDSRLPIPDTPYLHETLERMARAVNAHVKSLERRLATAGQGVPHGMTDRIEAAMKRIEDGRAPRRIPADPTDVDLVLGEVLAWVKGEAPPFWVPAAPTPEQRG